MEARKPVWRLLPHAGRHDDGWDAGGKGRDSEQRMNC